MVAECPIYTLKHNVLHWNNSLFRGFMSVLFYRHLSPPAGIAPAMEVSVAGCQRRTVGGLVGVVKQCARESDVTKIKIDY
jgi:hypothetical protein